MPATEIPAIALAELAAPRPDAVLLVLPICCRRFGWCRPTSRPPAHAASTWRDSARRLAC